MTEYYLELSYLFDRLRDAFYAEDRLDGCSKIEFFGRLANAANRCINQSTNLTAKCLYAAVLHEAFAIYEEMERGVFQYLTIAIGNAIYDDTVNEKRQSGYLSNDITLDFFRHLGIKSHWEC